MEKFDDFKLDLVKIDKDKGDGNMEPRSKSKSLCTPGCPTGILMICPLKTFTCGCF